MTHRRIAPNVMSSPASRTLTDRPVARSVNMPAGLTMAMAVTKLPSISATAAMRAFMTVSDMPKNAGDARGCAHAQWLTCVVRALRGLGDRRGAHVAKQHATLGFVLFGALC